MDPGTLPNLRLRAELMGSIAMNTSGCFRNAKQEEGAAALNSD